MSPTSIATKNLQAISGAPELSGKKVTVISKNGLTDFMQSIVFKKQENKEPFYVLDLTVVINLMDKWTRFLHDVRPFYAVKCNPDPSFLDTLADPDSSFDYASIAEIESVLALGVSPDRIVYANHCKVESHIKYAVSVSVNLTTFDLRHEVEKIRKWHPKCALLIQKLIY